ncbi:MAG TPA: response regulator transcription factor [Pirellulales bacterium]|nr:response regulator transcription factor [Pirellulales bacterium]
MADESRTTPARKSQPTPRVRVMIVDDHPLMRQGLAALISAEGDFEICCEASGVAEARQLAAAGPPHVAIVDLTLSDGSGLELLKEFRTAYPQVKLLVLTMHEEALFAERAMRAGAAGYVHKQQASRTIIQAIRCVLEGRTYLSQPMLERVVQLAFGSPDKEHPRSMLESLSDRELEVFGLIGRGMTTGAIASALEISHKTVQAHRERIKDKLKLKNSVELTKHAVQWVLEH